MLIIDDNMQHMLSLLFLLKYRDIGIKELTRGLATLFPNLSRRH